MRTAIVILTALALLPGAGAALQLRPGIEAGGSVVWTQYDEELEIWETGSRPDFNFATTLQFEFGPQGSLLAGLRYSGLGNEVDYDESRVPGSGGTISGTFEIQERYLGIPLAARWDFARTGGPFLFGGVEVAWLLGADLEYSERETPDAPVEEVELDVTDDLERVNVAGFVGAGLALAVATHEVEITVRYSYGFSDPAKDDLWVSGWNNQEIAVGVGFRL